MKSPFHDAGFTVEFSGGFLSREGNAMTSLLKRLKLRAAARAVHKDNVQANRYTRVSFITQRSGHQVHTLIFHLDIPDKQFAMTSKGKLARRHPRMKYAYIEIRSLHDLSSSDFQTLYASLRTWRSMKVKEVVPPGTPGIPH